MARLMSRERLLEAGRIVLVGSLTFLYWEKLVPQEVLYATLTVGLYPLIKTGLTDLFRERKIGTEIFVTIATVIAMIGKEYVAGAVLMTIILIAEWIADWNTDRARASIQSLIGSVPQKALVRTDAGEQLVEIGQLKEGDVVLVRAGDKIPVDGEVVSGVGFVNEATITGESLPKERVPGASVLAGTLLDSGALDVRTERVGTDTQFSRIIALVEEAEDQQAPVQKLADRVASWLIPFVLIFLIGVSLVTHDLRKIVTLLIFTSPAEIGLATPLVMISAIARAARAGILIKGGIYLESLARIDVILLDKTGTLTSGPKVSGVYLTSKEVSEKGLLRFAASIDRRSAHPLAQAIISEATARGVKIPEPEDFASVRGRGAKGTVDGCKVLVGNESFLREEGIKLTGPAADQSGSLVYVAADGILLGYLELADTPRPGAPEAIAALKKGGIKRIAMLAGDRRAAAEKTGKLLGIDEIYSDLLPEDKVKVLTALQAQGLSVAMVGDGVNDAPALARAQVGVAMDARGTKAALEAADVALMTDDLAKIVFARNLAQRAYRTIQENIFVGVGVVHALGISAALLGYIGPIQAAIIHLGTDILVFLNSMKLLSVRIPGQSGA
mgnify:CR=1 FL=1